MDKGVCEERQEGHGERAALRYATLMLVWPTCVTADVVDDQHAFQHVFIRS